MGFKPKPVHRFVDHAAGGRVFVLCNPYRIGMGPERYAAKGPITCKSCIGIETGVKFRDAKSYSNHVNQARVRDLSTDRESHPSPEGSDPKIA